MIGKRLFDRVMSAEEFSPLYTRNPAANITGKEVAQIWKGNMRDAQVFEITPTAEYFYAGTDQEEWDVFHDFPSLLPPYDNLWMEYTPPPTVRSNGNIKPFNTGGLQLKTGISIQTSESRKGHPLHPDVEFRAQMMQVFLEQNGRLLGPSMHACWMVDGAGKAFSLSGAGEKILFTAVGAAQTEATVAQQQDYMTMGYPALLAISFLNCRNTVVVDHRPDQKLSKVHQKRHGRPLTTFKTLEISQVKKLLNETKAMGVLELKHALHLCRGHFKNYNERPLFGRHKGMFWWGPTIRGTGPNAVIKDYAVKGGA